MAGAGADDGAVAVGWLAFVGMGVALAGDTGGALTGALVVGVGTVRVAVGEAA